MAVNYVKSFSKEWLIHRKTQLDSYSGTDESSRTFYTKTGFLRSELEGKRVLDVGCGMGRFIEVVLKAGASEIIGVDLSDAVQAATDNFRGNNNVTILQADLHELPFPDESFDIIYAIGVLHHTPDTEKAFKSLVRLLKPGGKIAIWVYPDQPFSVWLYNRYTGLIRMVTTRLPMGLLYRLCWLAIPAYYLRKLPVIGVLFRLLLPVSGHKIAKWRWLDTFDWYAPKYQHHHTSNQLLKWYIDSGLLVENDDFYSGSIRGRAVYWGERSKARWL